MSFKIVEPRRPSRPRRARFVVSVCGLVALASCVGAGAQVDSTPRILTLLEAAGEEYREAIDQGAVVRPVEYEEAKAFVEDARQRWNELALDAAIKRDIDVGFDGLHGAIQDLRDIDTVRARVDELRRRIVEVTGSNMEVYPPAPPSARRGHALFLENCSACHGSAGDGRGDNADKLNPRPANFTDGQFMRAETPYDFFHVITLGKRNSAMPAWGDVLSIQERWDLIRYLWTLSTNPGQVAEGQGIYLSHCSSCHGIGNDPGAWSGKLLRPAPDFRALPASARRSQDDMEHVVAQGVAGSPMPAFAHLLSDSERALAIVYLRHLALGGTAATEPDVDVAADHFRRTAKLASYLAQSYAQAWDGRAALVDPVELAEAKALADQLESNLPQLMAASEKQDAPSLQAALLALTESTRNQGSVASVREASDRLVRLIERVLPEPSPTPAVEGPSILEQGLRESQQLLEQALAAHAQGDARAMALVSDAYFAFEPVERHLGGVAPELKAGVEEKFVRLRQALKKPGDSPEARDIAATILEDYATARAHLQAPETNFGLLVQAAAILLREGFEIVLVIGALLGYVTKAGFPSLRRVIQLGTIAGIVASLGTAFAFGEVLRLTPGSASILEAITMLLAAGVLFWVSYWLVSKAEADRWQQYIRGKVHAALAGRRTLALAGAAFLAVYREGFETVLFFQALLAANPTGTRTISSGMALGGILLALVYALFRRMQFRLPIGKFFLVTGAFLYAMAAIFAAQGVYELQEVGWIPLTPVPWMPTVPLLGLFPTRETLVVQGVFLALLGYAVARLRNAPAALAATADTTLEERMARLETRLAALEGEKSSPAS